MKTTAQKQIACFVALCPCSDFHTDVKDKARCNIEELAKHGRPRCSFCKGVMSFDKIVTVEDKTARPAAPATLPVETLFGLNFFHGKLQLSPVTKSYWKRHKCLYDCGGTGNKAINKILAALGWSEIMEACYTHHGKLSMEKAKEQLLAAGFEWSDDVTNFVKSCY